MAKAYKSHRANPVKNAPAGAVAGSDRRRAKRIGRAELDAAAKQKASEKAGRAPESDTESHTESHTESQRPKEIGGPSGPEPTRYGDWEVKGRCVDF